MDIRGWKTRIPQLVLAAAILLIVSVAVPGITKDPKLGWSGPSSTGPSKTYTGSGPSPTILAQKGGGEDFTEVSIYDAPGDTFGYDWRLGVVGHELTSLDQNAVDSVQIEVEFYPEGDTAVTIDNTNQDPTDDRAPTSFTIDAAEIGAANRND